ncbi:MAG: MBL fold metallo-hydrolase [Anaerolineae bacterium]|nr:MBL fold metallo-hydrolase [Anaerolineae bacterium]
MIITLPMGMMEANCYVIYDEDGGEGVVVDPGGNGTPLLKKIAEHALVIRYILNTHGHFDHIAGNADLEELQAPLAIHPADRNLLLEGGGALWFGLDFTPSPEPAVELNEGLVLSVGRFHIEVVHTPGHTPGSICFYLPEEKSLISGDTLFAGSVGRTDLPGGNARILNASLQRLLKFPSDTRIYPGHGPASTLAIERRSNPWLH